MQDSAEAGPFRAESRPSILARRYDADPASVGSATQAMQMTPEEAIAFVRTHGIVLEAAAGPVPSLAEAIAGAPIQGSWWPHPRGKAIFRATRAVRAADEVLVCRLIDGKITLVHRLLWPALVRCAGRLQADRLARVTETHTAAGRHAVRTISFPQWVPATVSLEADALTERAALERLRRCMPIDANG